jgi:hypothetical protein
VDEHVPVAGSLLIFCRRGAQRGQEGQHRGEDEARSGVGQEQGLEGPGVMHVRDGGSEHGADPDRGVLRREVDGEHALLGRRVRGEPGDHGPDGREHRYPGRAVEEQGGDRGRGVVSPREQHLGGRLAEDDAGEYPARAEPVEQDAGDGHGQEAGRSRGSQKRADDRERDAARLMQVDERERDDQPVAGHRHRVACQEQAGRGAHARIHRSSSMAPGHRGPAVIKVSPVRADPASGDFPIFSRRPRLPAP